MTGEDENKDERRDEILKRMLKTPPNPKEKDAPKKKPAK